MSATIRAKKIAKLNSVLKKNFQPIKPPSNRSVLEHLVFACCLEDSRFDPANDAFARLEETYTGWNEIRVTTVNELSEVMSDLSDPIAAATRVKKSLYNVFESQYSWDLEYLRKENLGKATQKLQGYKAVTPFVASYVIQSGLGGHSIPLDESAMTLMLLLDIVSEKEAKAGGVPGLERAIPKTAGVEFGSLLHQLAVEYRATPYSNTLRALLLTIDPTAKERFPKRQTKKKVVKKAAVEKTEKKKTAEKPAKEPASKKTAAKASTKKPAAKGAAAKSTPKKSAPKKATPKKAAAKKATPKKKAVKKSANKKLSRKKPR